jgi:hypothetical protein
LVSKMERKVYHWCNWWISRGGILVLIKIVLEAIPMYWHLKTLIPKSILQGIRKICYNYLWKGSLEYKGLHLVNWCSLSKPKQPGGWGLKDKALFGHTGSKVALGLFDSRAYADKFLLQSI